MNPSRLALSPALALPLLGGAAIDVPGAVASTGVRVTGKVVDQSTDIVTPSSSSPPAR
jgi:hypothetical protein